MSRLRTPLTQRPLANTGGWLEGSLEVAGRMNMRVDEDDDGMMKRKEEGMQRTGREDGRRDDATKTHERTGPG